MSLRPGTAAPSFALRTASATTFSLADAAGQWLLLWWYPKASTPTCTKEGSSLRDAAAEFKALDCLVVGVSYDEPADNRQFAEEHSFGFPLLSDPDRQVSTAYDVVRPAGEAWDDMPYRVSYLIDPDGLIVGVYHVTDAAVHALDVIADLRSMPRHRGEQ